LGHSQYRTPGSIAIRHRDLTAYDDLSVLVFLKESSQTQSVSIKGGGFLMRFRETKINGLWIVETVPMADSRGSFARTFCKQEFGAHGLVSDFAQHSMSHSVSKHTLRGLHFQVAPNQEDKLVSCIRGAIWDVAVDLRPSSPTYLHWVGTVLSQQNGAQFYIPKGFAHGFQSLCDNAAVSYLISTPYEAASSRGLRFDDKAIGISWPAAPAVISEKDRNWPLLKMAELA
jgi:dTDP-4-dehydrorhamnose 3,5-epimerase